MKNETAYTFSMVVIDDNFEYRSILLDILQRMPRLNIFGVGESREDAVALCREYRPDILLLDAGMPSLGAIRAARTVREEMPRTEIVFMTTESSNAFGVLERNSPADTVISKHRIRHDLDAVLRRLHADRIKP